MGLLSRGGIAAGLGQALTTLGADKRAERLETMKYEREIALKKMEQEFQGGESAKQRDLVASEGGKSRQVDVGRNMQLADDAAATRELTASEGEKNRRSREKTAGMAAKARMNGGAGNKNKRWTIKALTNSDVKAGTQTQEISLTDNKSGRTFMQKNDIFLPQGAQPPQKRAPGSAINALMGDPTKADEFIRFYGYLPIEFFNSINNDGGEASPDVTDDEEE